MRERREGGERVERLARCLEDDDDDDLGCCLAVPRWLASLFLRRFPSSPGCLFLSCLSSVGCFFLSCLSSVGCLSLPRRRCEASSREEEAEGEWRATGAAGRREGEGE